MAALLRYLVDQALAGGGVKEYAVGIEVFGRNAASYHTGDDPIVRVQVGRLRAKLADYYADAGRHDPLRITIPLGTYLPRIEAAAQSRPAPPRLVLTPFACLSQEPRAHSLTLGLNEELGFRLHRDFGPWLATGPGAGGAVVRPASGFLLEGSVRKDRQVVRVALRLRDLARNHLVCSEQLDQVFAPSLTGQERLADACHRALLRHLLACLRMQSE